MLELCYEFYQPQLCIFMLKERKTIRNDDKYIVSLAVQTETTVVEQWFPTWAPGQKSQGICPDLSTLRLSNSIILLHLQQNFNKIKNFVLLQKHRFWVNPNRSLGVNVCMVGEFCGVGAQFFTDTKKGELENTIIESKREHFTGLTCFDCQLSFPPQTECCLLVSSYFYTVPT